MELFQSFRAPEVRETTSRNAGTLNRSSVSVHRYRRVQHLQRLANIGGAGALDILLAVTVACHGQALALGRRNVAAGVANARTRVERRNRALLVGGRRSLLGRRGRGRLS